MEELSDEDVAMAIEEQEKRKSEKQKLKEAIERIDDLEFRISELENNPPAHQHDGDGFSTTNY